MSLLEKFKMFVQQHDLFTPKDRLVLAVSGGVDSVVLCELCKQGGYAFVIAHCNFQLRGEESERDETFVKTLGTKYGVNVFVKKFDTSDYALDKKKSIQEAARHLRYKWFFELSQGMSNDNKSEHQPHGSESNIGHRTFVLTAHHADDNVETLLMNFFRGTGLHGLTGIPLTGGYHSVPYVRRPLLSFSKKEILEFARQNDLGFVEDSSNASSKYTRNLFRNEIIPQIEQAYPQVKDNLLDNIERFKEIEKLYKLAIDKLKKKMCKVKGDELHIPIKQLLGYNNSALVYEIISPHAFSEKQVDEVIKLANGDSGSYIDSASGHSRIIKHRHWLIITSSLSANAENIIIEANDKIVRLRDGKLQLEIAADHKFPLSNSIACFDLKGIKYPLLLRSWKAGDYFYPLGMKKKKKVARFFIDNKLSKTEKEKAQVLEMNKKIIWVVGYRIDERFKITGTTKDVLRITWTKEPG
jgi:tRNA(Ile)-lysidine synthase